MVDRPTLTDDEVVSLAKFNSQVEAYYSVTQVIEGTLDDFANIIFYNRVSFHSQRVPNLSGVCLLHLKQLLWSSDNITESFSGVSSTLALILAANYYDIFLKDLYWC
ncbi:hypothetical protein [Sodalis sp. RH20]|uniref:hypothetical protein n=1 Tax=unclassified Sodalis (in: enterobacteria) TaxID=2636512 RepID=UPI0039B3DA2D